MDLMYSQGQLVFLHFHTEAYISVLKQKTLNRSWLPDLLFRLSVLLASFLLWILQIHPFSQSHM